jgi:hypothetical protein
VIPQQIEDLSLIVRKIRDDIVQFRPFGKMCRIERRVVRSGWLIAVSIPG